MNHVVNREPLPTIELLSLAAEGRLRLIVPLACTVNIMSFLPRTHAFIVVLLLCGVACGPTLDPFATDGIVAGGSGGNGGNGSGGSVGSAMAGGGAPLAPIGGAGGPSHTGGITAAGSAGTAAGEGVGGEGQSGAGGTAGETSVVDPDSTCYGQTRVPAALVSDFEQGQEHWFAYVDRDEAEVGELHPGADGTNRAARFAGGEAAASGVGIGMFCDDVSSFDGVSFWAKGHGGEHLRFLVAIPATDATPGRGDCDDELVTCNDHPGIGITLESEWKQYSVPWSELEQYGWGEPAQFAGVANSLLWINDGPVAWFEFAIDEVRLYRGEGP